jgi:hypothetical protein
MRRVIVTSGPMGSGKSTYCNQLLNFNPLLTLISRDAILIELFGTVWLDSYSGGHFYAQDIMWKRVAEALKPDSVFLILDTWNGSGSERQHITSKLRQLGADWIIGHCFITPEKTALRWYIKRQSIGRENDAWYIRQLNADYQADNFHHDYLLYHSHGVTEEQGFDQVCYINPLQGDLWLTAPA